MLGITGMLVSSGDGGAAEPRESGGSGGGSEVGGGGGGWPSSVGFSEEEKTRMDEIDRNSGGNRWPRQETLILLQIRSDMDVAFRDSSLKGRLWEEVSRKLGELGYHRSPKKCKEKFENVYKYHRRTKEGRSIKSEGKTYRFFDQLEALENQAQPALPPALLLPQQSRPQSQQVTPAAPVAVARPAIPHPSISSHQFITVPSIENLNPLMDSQNTITNPPPPNQLPSPLITAPMSFSNQRAISSSHHEIPADIGSISTSSSSTSSDEETEKHGKRKRKWGDFFHRLMSEVIEKQEEMQRKFLDTLERREREREVREETWRAQETTRMNREHELLVHERSVAAAKDTAVIQFLQKISDQNSIVPPMQMQQNNPTSPAATPPIQPPPPPCQTLPHPQPLQQPVPHPQPLQQPVPHPQLLQQSVPHPPPPPPHVHTPTKALEIPKTDNGGGENFNPTSSSRWPKAEVEALIRLRRNMDTKYQENVPKGPLWEEISAAMRRIGYDRNSKRCKEKWENINKYFKKVKESNKKRPDDSKTCPYFMQLDALYKEKSKNENSNTSFNPNRNVFGVMLDNIPMAPIMVHPERQYRLDTAMEDDDSQNIEDEEGEDEDDHDQMGVYVVVPNQASNPVGTKME